MLEKLLSLLLHAKGGAVATVFVLGTTGALVTATVDNGLTTITITQPSAVTTGSQTTTPGGSTTTTTNTTVTETILALFNRTKAEDDPTGTATGNGCSDEAHARNDAVKDVNEASKTLRAEVKALGKDAPKTDANKKLFKDVDTAIKDIRQAVVKAIHTTFDCDKDDEDEDEDEDENNASTTTGPSVAFAGDDPKALADLAITAMKQQVTDLKAKLAAPTTTTNTTSQGEKAKSDSKSNKSENKGKGKDKRESRESDDEDDD